MIRDPHRVQKHSDDPGRASYAQVLVLYRTAENPGTECCASFPKLVNRWTAISRLMSTAVVQCGVAARFLGRTAPAREEPAPFSLLNDED